MAIATDSYIEVLDTQSVLQDKIGLSKTLDNYSMDEITAYCYCGADNNLIKYPVKRFDQFIVTANYVIPFVTAWNGSTTFTFTAGDRSVYAGNSDLYGRVVWLQNTTNISSNIITSSNAGNYKLVTELKANHYCYEWSNPTKISVGQYQYGTTDWNGSDMSAHKAWKVSRGNFYYYKDFTGGDTINLSSSKIHPFFICEVDGKVYCLALTPAINHYKSNYNYTTTQQNPPQTGYSYTSWDNSDSFDVGVAAMQSWDARFQNTGWNFPYTYNVNSAGQYGYATILQGYDEDNITAFGVVGGTVQDRFNGWEFDFYFNERDDVYKLLSGCGVYFKTDKIYKPIINNGYVTGYTDDLSTQSDIDTWEGSTNHNIPPAPPGPTPPGPGYDDDPWSGATFAGVGVGGAGAFAKCYYMTSTELANLRSWMNSINVPEGFDPMQQIIGLSQVPVTLSGDAPENVVFVNSSAVYDPGVTTRAVDTGVSTQQAMGTPISYYLGSVDIVRRMQERGEPYLDYDCQIELYLPLIGMFSLDTQAVMGRTISAYAVLDPVSGTLAAYAYVTKDGQNLPVAYGSTSIGVDLPISAQQLSVSRAALKQANAQLGASLLSGALTMLAAASSGGKSSGSGAKTSTVSSGLSAAGIREAGSDYMKASQVGNVFGDFMQWGRTIRQLSYGNNTAVAGSFGGSTAQWSYPFTPYVKIIRPRYEKPSNYAHSQGVPCVQTKTIGSCTGFIQCIGADVSGITGATDLELQAIQAALSNGIYAGGGS